MTKFNPLEQSDIMPEEHITNGITAGLFAKGDSKLRTK